MNKMRYREGRSVKWRKLPPNFNRKSFVIQWCIFFLALFTVIAIGIIGLDRLGIGTLRFGFFSMDFQCLAFMLFAGLFGHVSGMFATIGVFIYALIVEPENAYLVSLYLLAAILFSLAGEKRAFASKKKTFLFFLVASLLMAALSTLIILLRSYDMNIDQDMLIEYGTHLLSQSVQCLIGAYACRLFFKCAPDSVKKRVALGLLYYNKQYETDEEYRKALRRNVLGGKVAMLIIGEAVVMVIAAIMFTRILFPDLQRMRAHIDTEERTPGIAQTLENYNFYGFIPSQELRDKLKEQMDETLPEIEEGEFVYNIYSYAYITKMVLMLLCIGVPLAVLANYYAQVRFTGPISRISNYMVKFSRTPQKDLKACVDNIYKLDIHTHDEIEQLYHAVDLTVHDVVDMIDRIQQEAKLEEDLRVAEAASEAKSAFLSNMSHEIRTPINAVLGMDEMILRESSDPAAVRYATDIKNAGRTLLSLVNDILDFSKIEAGKMEILPVQYEVSSTMNDLVNMIAERARDKNLELIVHVDETIPHLLCGDEIRIKQCVTNILTNAVKYTEEGSVTLSVSSEKADETHVRMRYRVQDTGIGIKEEDLEKLYSPFERIEEIRNRTIEGTGLGMSIVKKLLAMMDTKLEVKSVYGEGSDFSFEILQEVIDWEPIGNFEENYRIAAENAAKYQESFHAPDAKVLIVDDTKMNLTVIEGLLKQTQVQVTTATSGKETLELVVKEKYDVILLDHRMPEMDGVETLAAMTDLDGNRNADTPVVALTANAVSGAREFYLEAGFKDYLSKPIDSEKLEKVLSDLIPSDKVILPGNPEFHLTSQMPIPEGITDENGYIKKGPVQVGNPLQSESGRIIHEQLLHCRDIDLAAATKNCGNEGILHDAIKEFLIALPAKSSQIEQYAADGDFRNYAVLVHALKSSARLIGAKQLSEDAAYLEKCGNEEKVDEIAAKTPALIELYRSYEQKLSAVDPGKDRADISKPEISEEDLDEAFSGLREFVEAYDFDSGDKIIKMLDGYKIPSHSREKYDKIKERMTAVDRDSLLEIL